MDPVLEQVATFNTHDENAYAAWYALDVVFTDAAGVVRVAGRQALVEEYAGVFNDHPTISAEVVSRQQLGDWTTQVERLHGLGPQPKDVLLAYHVTGALIDRVIALR